MPTTIKWNTPAGSIGTFTELLPVAFAFSANLPVGATTLYYELLNGSYPSVEYSGAAFSLNSSTGLLTGTPGKVDNDTISEFTIRVYAFNGATLLSLSDRTFAMTVTGSSAPSFVTPAGQLYAPSLDDSTWTMFQIEINNPDPNTTAIIRLVDGELPPGLEINPHGLIRGYAEPPVTALLLPTVKIYSFTLEVETESGVDYRTFQITVNNQELNFGYVGRAPAMLNTRPPSYTILPSDPNYGYYLPSDGYMGLFSQENNFVFNILGYDWAGQPLEFSLIGLLPSGLNTNFSYNENNISITIPVLGGGLNYAIGDNLRILGSDIGGLTPNHDIDFVVADIDLLGGALLTVDSLSFTGTNCNSSGNFDNVPIYTITGGGSGAIANVVKVGADWVTGSFDINSQLVDTYNFSFFCYNPQTGLSSDIISFSMIVAAANNNLPISLDVNWSTDANLGTLINGNISTFAVKASAASGLPLIYEQVTVTATSTSAVTNEITCDSTSILVKNQPIVFSGTTFGNIISGTIYYVLSIIDDTTFTVSTVSEGSVFVLATAVGTMSVKEALPTDLELNIQGEIVGRLAFESTDSLQSKNNINSYFITIRAYNTDYPEINSTKTFNFSTLQKFTDPYDNLYIKALLKQSDKSKLLSLLQDPILIPPPYLYRPSDPYFGVAKEVIYQHMFGVPVDTVPTYINAVLNNHYWRFLTLGPIKTAQARDQNNNVIYEVVYSEIVDDLVNKLGISITKEFNWPTLINGLPVTVFPNSLINMRKQIADAIPGQNTDSSILPLWMTTQQENGSILGFRPAWVICYTLPGYSAIIKSNIEQNWIYTLNELTFQIDRLEIDRSFTFDYDTSVPPGSWGTLPSGVTTTDEYDTYIYYPQKNILY